MRYLDPRITDATDLRDLYVAAIGVRFDSWLDLSSFTSTIRIGDVIVTSPFHSSDFRYLPSGVQVEVIPDGGKIVREEGLKFALRKFNVPDSFAKKAPTPKAESYFRYQEALAWYMENASSEIEVGESQYPWKLVADPTEAWNIIRGLGKKRIFALDFETTSLDPKEAQVVGIALADESMSWYIVDDAKKVWPELLPLLRDKNIRVVGTGVKYEYSIMKCVWGIDPMSINPLWDTAVMNWVYTSEAGGNDLKSTSRKYLGRDVLDFEDVVPKGSSITDIPHETVGRYAAAGDARNSFDLYPVLHKLLVDNNLLNTYETCELGLTPVLADIETEGAYLDREALLDLTTDYSLKLQDLEDEIRAKGFPFEPSQKDAFASYLYKELKLPMLKMTASESRGSVDNDTLKKIQFNHPVIKPYIEWVETEKLLNTFIIPRLEGSVDGQLLRLYYHLAQTSTATGRLASTDPNMQNWPMLMRKVVIGPPGYEVAAWDYNQIEPRIAAVASGDAHMLRAYSLPRYHSDGSPNIDADPYIQLGLDMGFDHTLVMKKDPKTRRIIKAVFLGWMFGAGAKKMQESAAKDDVYVSLKDAQFYARQLEENRPDFVRWRESVIMYAREHGHSRTFEGRWRVLNNINVIDPDPRGGAEREAVNEITQGTAQDIIKPPMPKIHLELRKVRGRMFNQVHDEVVAFIPEGTYDTIFPTVREMMEWYPKVPLYIEGGHGKNWYESKP